MFVKVFEARIRGHPHGFALLCKRICFASFWPIILVWTMNPHTLHIDDPSTYGLQPLNPTTMVDYVLVFMLHKIVSLLGSLGQNIMLLCHYAKQKKGLWTTAYSTSIQTHREGLSPSTVCLYTGHKLYVHAPSLLLCFWSATYRPQLYELKH